MKEPTHNLKRRFVNCNGAFWTTHNEHHGWLGSGVKDKNGVEIFEGDIVEYGCHKGVIVWSDDGAFCLDEPNQPLDLLANFFTEDQCNLTVIGHIADAEEHHDA